MTDRRSSVLSHCSLREMLMLMGEASRDLITRSISQTRGEGGAFDHRITICLSEFLERQNDESSWNVSWYDKPSHTTGVITQSKTNI